VKRYFAYIRVSTIKQGEKGVSLSEQRDIVERYAAHQGLSISRWFEERETASKIGRPLFNQMLVLLKRHQADGVIIHKVDRSARNRWDWAEVMQLREFGIAVHFAGESLDLNTPSGILAADIQAVMAVHYSRNLSEETKKGYYGRLKQGLCPFPAPLGYLNNGRGKLKTIDPILGPIVREAFELYATGRFSLIALTEELYRRGLRTRDTQTRPGGQRVGRSAVAAMLSNPFYIGVLHVKKMNRTFVGNHEPLISRGLFERVQDRLSGRAQRRTQKHSFQFARLIHCGLCGRALIGETHKGHTYYRCHTKHASTGLREERIEESFKAVFNRLALTSEESELVDSILADTKRNWDQHLAEGIKAEELRIATLQTKMDRLTDAYVESMLDRDEFDQKKTALILERREAEERLSEISTGDASGLAQWRKIVELIKTASLLYETGNQEEKREMVNLVMSNRLASCKTLDIWLRFPFSEITKRNDGQSGCPSRTGRRKFWQKLLRGLVASAQKTAGREDLLCA
jgi:site-specific DNA recombinase